MRDSTKPRAFTLIELLIVVAIIAILAAIAVPNFLTAQVRSKVSRAKSDMRSMATAIEAYAVDHKMYPPDGDDLFLFNPIVDFNVARRLVVITTPIGYITDLPLDPFNEHKFRIAPDDFANPLPLLFPGDPPYTYNYNTFGSYRAEPAYFIPTNKGKPVQFSLNSLGPSRTFDSLYGRVHYDPTNGAVSRGEVFITSGPAVDPRAPACCVVPQL